MKNFTKKFINNNFLSSNVSIKNIYHNAKESNKKLGIPEKLFLELSKEFPKSKLRYSCDESGSTPSSFIAGFCVGWAEKYKKIK